MSPMSPRLLRPKATGFTPKSISGLVGWWDASVSSSLAQSSNGTTAVTANNDPVAYWGDLSGNGNHLTQTTNNNRPTYVTGSLNGRPSLSFDGSNDTLGASFTLAQPCTHFIVFKFNAAYSSGNPRIYDGWSGRCDLFRSSATQLTLTCGTSNDSADVTDAEMQTFGLWDIEANGTSSFIRRAGVRRDLANTDVGTSAAGGIRLAVFNNGFSAPGNVAIAEVAIYNRILTASEATRVRRYLGTKYNLPFA